MSTYSPRKNKIRTDVEFNLDEAGLHLEAITGEKDPIIDFRCIPEKGTRCSENWKDALADLSRAKAAGNEKAIPDAQARVKKYGPTKLRGTLSRAAPFLRRMNMSGRAVYFMLNPTDGQGATKAHVTAVRCIGLDLDGTPLPYTFESLPHIIVQTSENDGNPKYQVVWRIKLSDDFDYCKRIPKH